MEQLNDIKQNVNYKITVDTVLFFDMDGTLIDTNLANFLSYEKAIQSVTNSEYDLNYNPDKRFNRSNLKISVPNLSNVEYERIVKEKEEYFKYFLNQTTLKSEIVDILFKYSKMNKTILVTNCRKDRALSTLNHFGLTDKFEKIFYRKFDENGKKINKFENAIFKLGVEPNLVVVFENEEIEIADAIQAGIKIINPLIA